VAHRIFSRLRKQKKRPRLVNHLHGASYLDFEVILTERARGHVKYSPLFMAMKSRYASGWDLKGARACDVVVTQCIRDEDYMNDLKELDPLRRFDAPVVRIPATLHPTIAKASALAVAPETRDPYAILWFGTWGERKGCHYVNRAFREIKAKHPQATLTLGGTGFKKEAIEAFFDPALRDSIRVLPRIDIATQLAEFNRHSIFIFPSLSEGFGLALIEAMAMGLACVTTMTGMVPDWISDREEALLVPPASAEHLARAVCRLMTDDALRIKIANAGQSLARTFTVKRFVSEYLEVFQSDPAKD
jgi:glycosyltransferase involved in cell wall biosynthesis